MKKKQIKTDRKWKKSFKNFDKETNLNKKRKTRIFISSIVAVSLIFGIFGFLLSTGKVSFDNHNFSVDYYGKEQTITFKAKNVTLKKLLAEFEFKEEDKIKVNDEIVERKDFNISIGSKDFVEIIKVTIESEIVTNVIDFEVIEKDEPTIKKGNVIVAKNGEKGEEQVEIIRYYENDKFVSEEKKIVNTKEVVNQLVLIGSGNTTTYTGPIDNGLSDPGKAYEDYNKPSEGEDYEHNPGATPHSGEDCKLTVQGVEIEC